MNGIVYTIAVKGSNVIKIGKTRRLAQRMHQIKVPELCEVLALEVSDDYDDLEKALHDEYYRYSLPQAQEWFALDFNPRDTFWARRKISGVVYYCDVNQEFMEFERQAQKILNAYHFLWSGADGELLKEIDSQATWARIEHMGGLKALLSI